MSIFKAQGQGAGKTPACPCILPFKFERLPVGGKYRFIFGSSPAVTGRDWQEGNNVLLSGNIGKEVVTGNTRSWRSLTETDRSSLCGQVGVSGLVSNSPVRRTHLAVGDSYQIGRVEVLVPPGYRVSGPWPAAVGVTELGGVVGAAEGRRSANATGPPRGPLEDWSGPVVG
jgi:hypothetical protein